MVNTLPYTKKCSKAGSYTAEKKTISISQNKIMTVTIKSAE